MFDESTTKKGGKAVEVAERPALLMPTFVPLPEQVTGAELTLSSKPKSMSEVWFLSQVFAQSDVVPTGFRGKPADVFVCIMYGLEVGLPPLQALQSVAVINGRPCIWGDGMLALVLASGRCEYVKENNLGEIAASGVATCETLRKGSTVPVVQVFTADMAERAGLLKKPGPWQEYPYRMLQMRARAFALRDAYADVLKGMISVEEALDIPGVEHGTVDPVEAARRINPTGPVTGPIGLKNPDEPKRKKKATTTAAAATDPPANPAAAEPLPPAAANPTPEPETPADDAQGDAGADEPTEDDAEPTQETLTYPAPAAAAKAPAKEKPAKATAPAAASKADPARESFFTEPTEKLAGTVFVAGRAVPTNGVSAVMVMKLRNKAFNIDTKKGQGVFSDTLADWMASAGITANTAYHLTGEQAKALLAALTERHG